jgi:hypothetical protein
MPFRSILGSPLLLVACGARSDLDSHNASVDALVDAAALDAAALDAVALDAAALDASPTADAATINSIVRSDVDCGPVDQPVVQAVNFLFAPEATCASDVLPRTRTEVHLRGDLPALPAIIEFQPADGRGSGASCFENNCVSATWVRLVVDKYGPSIAEGRYDLLLEDGSHAEGNFVAAVCSGGGCF